MNQTRDTTRSSLAPDRLFHPSRRVVARGLYEEVKMLLGAPWWFYDSPLGMRRYLDAVIETAGVHNTAGFNDDTRAFASIASRHDVWGRVTCDWLAERLTTGTIDEEDARAMARDFACDLAKRAYNLEDARSVR